MYSSDLVYDAVAGCDKHSKFLMLLTLQKLVVTASISSGRMELLIREVAKPDRVQYRGWVTWTHLAMANPHQVKKRFFMKHGVPYVVELNYEIPSGEGRRLVHQTMQIGAVCESRWRKEFCRNGSSVSTLWINITWHLQHGAMKLVLCSHWMHLSYMHPVTSDNQFHCAKLYYQPLVEEKRKKDRENCLKTRRFFFKCTIMPEERKEIERGRVSLEWERENFRHPRSIQWTSN